MRRLLVLAALLVALPAGAVTIDWVPVGEPGNAGTNFGSCGTLEQACGSVHYEYMISEFEITNAQYADFLNAVALADPNGLYNQGMGAVTTTGFGGITRSGTPGNYSYTLRPGMANKPVAFVSYFDAVRFANWLHNGQPVGSQGSATTEDGAYTITGPTLPLREQGSLVFLPNRDEWYKAGYFNPVTDQFGRFPTPDFPLDFLTDACVGAPANDTGHSANCGAGSMDWGLALTDVGAYSLTSSPWGTFDQAGNVHEWAEHSRIAGSSYVGTPVGTVVVADPSLAAQNIGFRVAYIPTGWVPEPGTGLLVMTGLLGLAARRQRRV